MKIKSDEFRESIEKKYGEGYRYLTKITAVDYGDHLEALYFIRNFDNNQEETIRFDLPSKNPKVKTIIDIYAAADWYERELSEMFGIEIIGRRARRLLLEKWDGRDPPLRKSFIWNKPYEGMEEVVRWADKYKEKGAKGK